jgi:hypothetical protein
MLIPDLPPRDWAAIATISAFIVTGIAVISRWSGRKTDKALALLAQRFTDHAVSVQHKFEDLESSHGEKLEAIERALRERLGAINAGMEALGRQSLESISKASEASAYALRGAEFMTLEFERTRGTVNDLGLVMQREIQVLKKDRIEPLEVRMHVVETAGCAQLQRHKGNGG